MTVLTLLSGCYGANTPVTPAAVATATGWELLAPGLERRTYAPPQGGLSALVVLRLDPSLYDFRVHYRPGGPLLLNDWAAQLPGAAAFVNASFFDPQFNALGLVVADGAAYGQTYVNRGGMFQVQAGAARVRSLILEPYLGEPLEQAVQAFPMLVVNGLSSFDDRQRDRVSRRTVIAQDAQGRILLIATPFLGITLGDLADYLPTTDMQIVNALNLDGGGSTLMSVAGASPYALASFDAVPTVLAVYPR